MKRRNPRFGCVRIAQQISHAFGVRIDKGVVRRVLVKHYRPGDSGATGPSYLRRKLDAFAAYCNAHRVHRSLDGTTPAQRAGAPSFAAAVLDNYAWQQHCGGLFQTPIAA